MLSEATTNLVAALNFFVAIFSILLMNLNLLLCFHLQGC